MNDRAATISTLVYSVTERAAQRKYVQKGVVGDYVDIVSGELGITLDSAERTEVFARVNSALGVLFNVMVAPAWNGATQ